MDRLIVDVVRIVFTRSYRIFEHLSIICKIFQRRKVIAILKNNANQNFTFVELTSFTNVFYLCVCPDTTMSMSTYVWVIWLKSS